MYNSGLLPNAGKNDSRSQECTDQSSPSLDVRALLKWAAHSADIECDALAAGDNLAVRGVVARRHISSRSVVISLPRRLTLTVKAGQSSPMPDVVPEKLWKSCDSWVPFHMDATLKYTKRTTAYCLRQ